MACVAKSADGQVRSSGPRVSLDLDWARLDIRGAPSVR